MFKYTPGNTYYRTEDVKNAQNLQQEIGMLNTMVMLLENDLITDPQKLIEEIDHPYANDLYFVNACNQFFDPKKPVNSKQHAIDILKDWADHVEKLSQQGPDALYDYWHYWD